jgi:hypothetical protein
MQETKKNKGKRGKLKVAVHLSIRQSLIFVSSMFKHPRPEIQSYATNYMPEVVSDLPYDFKKVL